MPWRPHNPWSSGKHYVCMATTLRTWVLLSGRACQDKYLGILSSYFTINVPGEIVASGRYRSSSLRWLEKGKILRMVTIAPLEATIGGTTRRNFPHNRHMKPRGLGVVLCVLTSIAVLAGCSFDPQARKKRDFEKGNVYFQAAKYREAAIEYANAIQIDPKYADAHFQLAQCYLKESRWNAAYTELLRTVSLAPENTRAQLDLAELLVASKPSEARQHAEAVLGIEPHNAQAQILLSQTYASSALPQAIEEAKKAVAMDATRSDTYLNLALLQERNKDFAAAEQNFQKAVSAEPKSAAAAVDLGRFYMGQNRPREAEKQFLSAIGLSPRDANLRAILANFYVSQQQPDKAEQVLRAATVELKDNPAGYRLLGDFYLRRGQTEQGAAEFASLYREHPKDFPVAKSYAQILIDQNKLDEATAVDDRALKAFPQDPEARLLRGEILIKRNRSRDAVTVLASVATDTPDSVMAHYQLGAAYAGLSNWVQAETEWRTAARLRPNAVEPERALAALAERSQNKLLLADASQALIRIEPNSPEGYLFHSRALSMSGDTAGAEKDIRKAMQVAPADPSSYLRLAQMRVQQGQFDEAEKLYEQALVGAPANQAALAGIVSLDLQRNDAAKALRRVQDQIAKVPNISGFYTLLGQLELRSQDQVKSEAALQRAIELDKHNVDAFLLLSNLEVSKGSVQQAADNYKSALQSNPNDVRLYVSLGELYETQNQWQQAEELYKKALQIQPDYPIAANNLAYLMLAHGENPNVAFTLAQTARKGLPNTPNTADTLGWAYYNQGIYLQAIDLFQQAIKGDPRNANYHYHLGMAYQKQANYALARKQFEEALAADPGYGRANEIRKLLAESHN